MSEHKFTEAYNDLMAHMYEIMDDGLHSVADGLEKAKAKSHALTSLTQEELHKVGEYLQRDLEDAAHSLSADRKNDLSEWLKFDVNLLENFALEAFLSVADKTRVELAKIQALPEAKHYHAGEITRPGRLVCLGCGYNSIFKTTSKITPCPECGNTTFNRS